MGHSGEVLLPFGDVAEAPHDSFFTESAVYFKRRLIKHDGPWSKHAESSLENQSIPTQRHTLSTW